MSHDKEVSSTDRDKAHCVECGHDKETWNPVNGFCEFDPEPENNEVDYCGCKCVFGFDSEGDRIIYGCSLREVASPEWGNPPKMVTEFDEEKLVSSINSALAEVRRETWEAASRIVKDRLVLLETQTSGLLGDPLAHAGCSGRDSAIREIDAALASAKEKDEQR